MRKNKKKPIWLNKILLILTLLGPGLITASADNDAPGIATYSMVGSAYGYNFLWLILVITIGEVVILEMAARMGAATGKGTADLIREKFGVKMTTFAMFCLLIANLGTTVAEFAGIAAAGELFGISKFVTVPIVAAFMGLLIFRGNYKVIEKIFIGLSLAALSYIFTVFIIKPDWGMVLHDTLRPQLQLSRDFIISILAVIGTTITPWAIFYLQASVADKGVSMDSYKETKIDVTFGSAWGNVISACIIIVSAATLFKVGIRVEDAKDAAMALAPLAGEASTVLFAVGLLGASLLAVSVLPLSTTYAVCEAFGFERGLNRSFRDAPIFYGSFIGIIVLSVLIVLIPGMPLFQIMILSQTLNAILLPIILALVLKLANDRALMGQYRNSKLTNILAVAITTLIVFVTAVLLLEPIINLI
ncbi:MAG TPA: Nramp family divalent metal transporter [Anaerolineaceae bacterium]|nr:Nramp family divalent metal transporter [Anaerolineaceae bacterium]